ncbi:hypothetical protein KY46_03320 [Photobacterium halotolerans]|uniref:Uncharacterized protein n=1 Tax=Photobacterium halotolerans TaxID=265726 RepID=A0A0F5VF94_9GAMM|nr:hypothetical protein KY46_03320 [Photobacterium halotolerans]
MNIYFTLYIIISITGLTVGLKLIKNYHKAKKEVWLYIYFSITALIFGSQHYSIFFDSHVNGYLFYPDFDSTFIVTGWIRILALFFLISHVMIFYFKRRPICNFDDSR